MFVNNTRPDSDASVVRRPDANEREYLITNLKKWTEYRVWMLAGTVIGDGVKSDPQLVRTDEDGMYLFCCLSLVCLRQVITIPDTVFGDKDNFKLYLKSSNILLEWL